MLILKAERNPHIHVHAKDNEETKVRHPHTEYGYLHVAKHYKELYRNRHSEVYPNLRESIKLVVQS